MQRQISLRLSHLSDSHSWQCDYEGINIFRRDTPSFWIDWIFHMACQSQVFVFWIHRYNIEKAYKKNISLIISWKLLECLLIDTEA